MTAALRPSYDPFRAPVVDAPVPDAEHLHAAFQDKPWGHEVLFADGTNGYVGKLITVLAGRSLSLQLHHRKDETITVVSGEMVFESGPSAEALEATTMLAGDTVHVPALVVHRIVAVTDVVLAEVSTAQPGWRDDVVRLTDDYGRAGTSAP
jgi:mannose-6-phosphate isomerase-like protein (cupin superfamily)